MDVCHLYSYEDKDFNNTIDNEKDSKHASADEDNKKHNESKNIDNKTIEAWKNASADEDNKKRNESKEKFENISQIVLKHLDKRFSEQKNIQFGFESVFPICEKGDCCS